MSNERASAVPPHDADSPEAVTHPLIGRRGSRFLLRTPALLLDVDILDRNIGTMANFVKGAGMQLRPHCKGHKCVEIARRQISAGAVGISCATLGEAETMVAADIPGVLITSPITNPGMIARLIELNDITRDLLIVVDSAGNLEALDAAATGRGHRLAVVVEMDVGQGRTGAIDHDAVVDLARRASQSDNLEFAGVQAYYGHLQHIARFDERRTAIQHQLDQIRDLLGRLCRERLAPRLVTGGGTGSCGVDGGSGVFSELQPGSYLFLDREYADIESPPGGKPAFTPSLFVQATVISGNRPQRAIVNAGYKSFATETVAPMVSHPRLSGATYEFMGDEHGLVTWQADSPCQLAPGDVVEFLTPHCDPTINLYDRYHCVREDTLVDLWRIDARGR